MDRDCQDKEETLSLLSFLSCLSLLIVFCNVIARKSRFSAIYSQHQISPRSPQVFLKSSGHPENHKFPNKNGAEIAAPVAQVFLKPAL
ncbi:MAG: hypothetical protein ICV60_17715 [Pyrinomonadaceae bacterium]|nr:hypothetical protein [Pyrinomonadaceae bacterium]